MAVGFLLDRFREHSALGAVAADHRIEDYAALLARVQRASERAQSLPVRRGDVIALESDYSASCIAWLLALHDAGAIVVPIAPGSGAHRSQYLEIAQVQWRVEPDADGGATVQHLRGAAAHPLYEQLRAGDEAGIVLFTSGYTGVPKGVLHSASRLLQKYHRPRQRLRTVLFLQFDHIGGLDTLFQAVSNTCLVVVPPDRTADGVCAAIAEFRAEVLPASPSFLTLLLLSEAHIRHDVSSLRYITYGAEVMPQSTLDRLAASFPKLTLLQKYGLTEVGTLRSRSERNDSRLVSVGGEGFETRVVDGLLQIRAASSMLGYLNAPSPFTPDGWFMTGDAVEVHGEQLRILGRASDMINVGGRKVFPAEVEAVILEVENVAEAAVSGESHPLMGQIVVARVALVRPEGPADVEARVRRRCRERLAPHQVPVRVDVSVESLHDDRQKVRRH